MLRWGIIGCGSVADKKGGPALYSVENSRLVAVASRTAESASRFAAKHGVAKWYPDTEALLSDAEINAVYIATPVCRHHPLTLAAARAGKHVLCEKPLGMNPQQSEEMIETCRRQGVQLMCAYYRRYYPNIEKLRQLLADGAIGTPLFARVVNHSPFPPPTGGLPPTGGPLPWRLQKEISGGGVLMDLASHRIDLLIFLFGAVSAVHGRALQRRPEFPVDDTVAFQLHFDCGVLAQGEISWSAAGRTDLLIITGSAGRLVASPLNSGSLILENEEGQKEFTLPRLPYTHVGLVADLIDFISVGTPTRSPGESALLTDQVIAEIYRQSNSPS